MFKNPRKFCSESGPAIKLPLYIFNIKKTPSFFQCRNFYTPKRFFKCLQLQITHTVNF